jgi:hypothetical protein
MLTTQRRSVKMRSLIILSILFYSFLFAKAQHVHNDIEHTISVGLGGIILPYTSIQLEHTFYKSKISIGEHVKTFFTIKDNSIFFTGPQLELFGRYYFTDQRIIHGNHWFLHLKAGYGNMSIPWSDNQNDYLYDVSSVMTLDDAGNPIKIYNDNLIRYGGGIAFGYKTCSCKDWIFEVLVGYNFWSSPDYYSAEYLKWKNDDPCNCTNYKESKWTYGFPLDIQIKFGKLLGYKH